MDTYLDFFDDDILLEADEPMEQDADMGSDGDMGEGDPNPDAEDGDDMDMGDDMGMGDEGGEETGDASSGGDAGMGGDPVQSLTPTEALKKQKLFTEYRNLLHVMETAMESSEHIDYYSMSEDGKKIFNYLERKMNENHDKLILIMTEQYSKLPYSQLLTLYMYAKITVKSYSDILSSLFERTIENS